MTLIEENIEMLNERVRKCETKLNEVMDKFKELNGYLAAFRGDNNIFHMQVGTYLKNLNRQVYNIKREMDISVAYKEFKKEWDDEDNFG
ncbi:MAG TPA: hypothetical protein LFW20_01230 [Rickettsia endosymbiont of Omalisus fontisbellaquei]|nr:hypothetical protein [Rickettsia endosymbiont of Omalisus fontisbellaquei]